MAIAEGIQQDGIDGVELAKRWLESTTWIDLPFDVYTNTYQCTVQILGDKRFKRFDLAGHILTSPPTSLYVEVKNYTTQSGLEDHFKEFLANSYSAIAHQRDGIGDSGCEFMFVTTHPFSLGQWSKALDASRVQDALEKLPEKLAGKSIDVDLLGDVTKRVWLLVFHPKQETLMLSAGELAQMEAILNRKARK
jgi:hypothetical protein